MKVICVDDAPVHQNAIKGILKAIDLKGNFQFEVAGVYGNGKEGVDAVKSIKPDLIFLDIRMPVMDGLSALVRIKSISPSLRCIMASSEDERTIARKRGSRPSNSMSPQKKMELLDKVATRIRLGKVEEGKINSILDGCEELDIDPIEAAQHFKADGYMHKPYNAAVATETITKVMGGAAFTFIRS